MSSKAVRKLAAIMFTDMVGYTSLMQTDEEKAISLRNRHRDVIRDSVAHFRGEVLQYYGDGTLCVFDSSIDAVECAVQIQRDLHQEPTVPLRIGLHTGDIVFDDEGIYGDGVNVSSRIESLSIPGAVLISERVMEDVKNHPIFSLRSLGRFELKNVERPMEIFAVTNSPLTVPGRDEIEGKGRAAGKSLAVLPFINMSSDADNEYFSDGITEELLNALTKIDGLTVTARTSAFAFKGKNLDVRKIARQLNVERVLEGSVRKAGKRVRITAQLIDAADGYHLWSETYDRSLDDIFAVQDEISETIARRFREHLAETEGKSREPSRPTDNLEAYTLYLKGNWYWNQWSPENVRKAIECYEAAIALAPDFALPYTGLASALILLGTTGNKPPGEAFPKARQAALKSLELEDQGAESHLVVAMVKHIFDHDPEGAEASFSNALRLNSGSAQAHQYYAMFLNATGRKSKALEEITHAHRLDPLSLNIMETLGETYLFNRRFEESLSTYDDILEMSPNHRGAWHGKGWLYAFQDDWDNAVHAFETYQKMTGSELKGLSGIGFAYARTGRTEEALECIRKLEVRAGSDSEVDLAADFAVVYLGLRDWPKVELHLEDAFRKGIGAFFISTHPMWEEVRDFDWYKALVEKYQPA